MRSRSALSAYGIGLVHGMGGSAGVGVLLLAAIPDHVEALGALLVFAACTAVSMSVASTTFGYAITRGPVLTRFLAVAPALGAVSLAILGSAAADVTGLFAASVLAGVGLWLLPRKRRQAQAQFRARTEELRGRLMTALRDEFQRELQKQRGAPAEGAHA